MFAADGDRLPDAVGPTDDQLAQAIEFAFRYLDRRARTVDEMRRHLELKRVEASVVDRTLGTLIEDGYLDDARLARLFAEDKRDLEHWGAGRIERALLERGIDCELVDSALAAPDSEGELDRALALLRRRLRSAPRDRREREHALGVLLRKGYEPELALEALLAFAREAGV
jgi:regulatory protein